VGCRVRFSAQNMCRSSSSGATRTWLVKLSALLPLLVFAACAAVSNDTGDEAATSSVAHQPPIIQTIQPGDSELSCENLMKQMAQMDQIAVDSAAGGQSSGKSVTGTAVRSAVGEGLGFIPYVGSVVADVARSVSGGRGAREQQLQKENTMTMAQQRKQHLLNLYDQKKCSIEPEK